MDVRTELAHIHDRGYRWYQENLGDVVIWHEYDSENTEYDNTYDEGGRHYLAGRPVPVLWVTVREDRAVRAQEGRKQTEKISLAISAWDLANSGVSDPEDYVRHQNDVIRYEGRLYKIDEYRIRGAQVYDTVVFGVDGTQIYDDEEMTFDSLPADMDVPVHRSLPYPNNAAATFPEHDNTGQYAGFYTSLDDEWIIDGGTAET